MSEKDLKEARAAIDRIDREMAQLFEERMAAASKIAAYKQKTGLPVFDPAREAAILSRGGERVKSEAVRGYYINYLHAVMDISKAYQTRLMSGMHVAFSGTPGAFAHIAAKRIFPQGVPVGFGSFEEAYKAVEDGRCDVAVLPLENSFNGDVGTVMDLSFFGSLFVNGIYRIPVEQHLLGKKGASLSDIKAVISHPQALGQCGTFLKKGGYELREAVNTAVAAKMVAEGEDRTLGAIGSREAAEEYGLAILQPRIHDKEGNTTRFAVFSRTMKDPCPDDRRFLMLFTVKNEAGALAKAISAIGGCGFNLQAIKSRPTKHLSWEYYFFCEGEGNLNTPEGKKMLLLLEEVCNDVKILGSFEKENEPE